MSRPNNWIFLALMLVLATGQKSSAEDLFTQVTKSTAQIKQQLAEAKSQIDSGNKKGALQTLTSASERVDKLPLGRTSGIFTGVTGGQLRMFRTQIGKLLLGLDDKRAESEFKKAIAVPEVFGDIQGLSEAQSALADLHLKQGKSSNSQTLKTQSLLTEKLAAAESAETAVEKEKFAKEAIAAGLKLPTPNAALLKAYRWLGRALEEQNKFQDAESPFKDRLALAEKMNRPFDAADSVLDLGMLGEANGDYDAAEKLMRDAVARYEKLGEKNRYAHQRLSYFLSYKKEGTLDARKFANRGIHLQLAKRYEEANSEFEKALKSAEQAKSLDLVNAALDRLKYVNRCLNRLDVVAEYEKQQASLKTKAQ